MPEPTTVAVSIVSHRQGALVANLLADLAANCATPIEVILTVNVPEALPFGTTDFGFPIRLVENTTRKGFAANHNAAFRHAAAPFFCVLNPDIRVERDPFPALIAQLAAGRVGTVAPRILGAGGEIEDSARRFPSFASIARKALTGFRGDSEYLHRTAPFSPDWVAGMFLLFRTDVFRELGGFDERYFLYYEDVDLCARLRHRGYDIRVVPAVRVRHLARRESHRNPRYLLWHVRSLLRFLLTTARLPRNKAA